VFGVAGGFRVPRALRAGFICAQIDGAVGELRSVALATAPLAALGAEWHAAAHAIDVMPARLRFAKRRTAQNI